MLFPGLQFSAHGLHATARAALPGWGWPTMADGMREVFRTTVVVLGLGGANAGCAPPPLTSNVLSGNTTSSYLDTVQHANPTGVDAAAVGLKIAIASRGDNTTERLIARVNEAQGVCDRSGAMIRCFIDRSIVERNCFQGRCGDSRKRWTLSISWRDAPSAIDPQVTLKMSWPERP
jgi:hypothetical protein